MRDQEQRAAARDGVEAAHPRREARRREVAPCARKDRASYGNAVRHLRAMRKAAEAHDRGAEVIAFARAAREEHTRRRTLVTMLDKLGWW